MILLIFYITYHAWLFLSLSTLFRVWPDGPIRSEGQCLGILTLYALSMLTGSIQIGFLLATGLGVLGTVRLLLQISRTRERFRIRPSSLTLMLWFGIILIFALVVLVDPIRAWDARSIWFYQGKVIFFTQDIWAGGDWKGQAHFFSHWDYPKLFPFLAAHTALLFGVWNEFIPKLSLALLAMPLVLFAFEPPFKKRLTPLGRSIWTFCVLMTFLCFDGSYFFLTSGYMDGWLALYSLCVAMIAVNVGKEMVETGTFSGLPGLLLFGGILAQLKQEGMVLFFVIFLSLLLIASVQAGFANIFRLCGKALLAIRATPSLPFVVILAFPIIAWIIGVQIYTLNEGMHYGGNFLQRAAERLNSPNNFLSILGYVIFHNAMLLPSLFSCLLTFVLCRTLHIKFNMFDYLPILAATVYFVILITVYLGTAVDLEWHLQTSSGRTGLSISMLFICFHLQCILKLLGTHFSHTIKNK